MDGAVDKILEELVAQIPLAVLFATFTIILVRELRQTRIDNLKNRPKVCDYTGQLSQMAEAMHRMADVMERFWTKEVLPGNPGPRTIERIVREKNGKD